MKRNLGFKTLISIVVPLILLTVSALAYVAFQNNKAQAAQETQTPHAAGDGHNHGEPGEDKAEQETTAPGAQTTHAENDGHNHGQPSEGKEAHGDEAILTPEAIQQNGIRVEAVHKQALGEILTVPARVSYNLEQMAHVGTPVQGRVVEINVKLGDKIEKGDALLIIDSPALGEAQSDFLQKNTQVEVAASAVEVTKLAADRAKRLLEGKGISLGEYQRREGEYKFAVGALKSAKSALTAAENTLHLYGVEQEEIKQLIASGEINPRYTVRASIDGQVVQREATLGEVVGPDREALLTLANMNTLWVLADVPENQIRRVAVDAAATVTIEALGDKRFQGRVAYIAPELDKETRTAQVRIVIEDGTVPINPGMFAQVQLAFEQTADQTPVEALMVPEAAVQIYEGGPTVFVEVPGEPGAFASRSVKLGPSNGQAVTILEGLEEGSRIVVDGAFVIKAELVKGIMEGKTCSGH